MKNQILEILVDFTDKVNDNTSIFNGSLYTKNNVVEILSALAQEIHSIEEQPTRPSSIDADIIKAIALIAERWAINYAQNCAENYEFDENIEFHTNEYRGELNVTASVDVDTHSLARSATFHTSLVEAELRELLTPNVTPPNTENNA
jgi:hypothetical protein